MLYVKIKFACHLQCQRNVEKKNNVIKKEFRGHKKTYNIIIYMQLMQKN